MKLKEVSLKQSLNAAYRLVKPQRAAIDKFKDGLNNLLHHINEEESEENVKIHLMDFLKNTLYSPEYLVATKGRTDFVIHTGKEAKQPAGVLCEVKRPANKTDMITKQDLNRKAMHELVLYFLRERITGKNIDIRHLIITNIYEWFIFDGALFERLFAKSTKLVKEYNEWHEGQKITSNTDLFYNAIVKPFIASIEEEISFTWFDIREFEKPLKNDIKTDDTKLISLYKIFSPTHLLNLSFSNDSNTLDKGFYTELLHLIGLEEEKEGSKKLIRRKKEGKRDPGSLLENTITILELEDTLYKVPDINSYGETQHERLFSIALELCITWVNRILFLKLLEAQLIKYHKGDRSYKFLNYSKIPQYDELYKLFFQVLAKKQNERIDAVKTKFANIPYLNSSLFEISELEDRTIRINSLDDTLELNLIAGTVLKDKKNKPIAVKLNSLQYLFEFLDAYDFASEGSEEIQEESKTLINASVLGLIFEKINGYKDGSFFTPGFITMYMCRQSIRQAVLQKFKEEYKWECTSIEELARNYVADKRSAKDILKFNETINSLKICDPAVGSGHFLVSSLNEIIAIKSELQILADENGLRLSGYGVTIENDELIITSADEDIFEYQLSNGAINKEAQRVQETLFHEKQTIIENCLFGVDINPNSVKICRLRLWIELLKNAYYTKGSSYTELETLPNIDINIKCGNSLISRFALDENLNDVFKQSKYNVETYKLVVKTYKDSKSKEEKAELQKFVTELKEQFKTIIYRKDPIRTKLQTLRGDLLLLTTTNVDLFGKKRSDKDVELESRRLQMSIAQREKELQEKEKGKIFNNAFEWRFEFPEILDDEGKFTGFDVIIGNPPYKMIQPHNTSVDEIMIYKRQFDIADFKIDLFHLFFQLGNKISKTNGYLNFIAPSTLLYNVYTNNLRNWLKQRNQILEILVTENKIFDEADVHTAIYFFRKATSQKNYEIRITTDLEKILNGVTEFDTVKQSELGTLQEVWNLLINSKNFKILYKITNHKKLNEIADINRGLITGDRGKYFSPEKKNEKYIPILTGSDIYRYYIKEPSEYVFFKKPKTAGGCWDEKVHLAPHKLCIRQIGKDPTAAIITKPYAVTGNIFTVIAENITIEKYILAIINSRLIKYFWSVLFYDFKSSFPQVTINSLNIIPIPDGNEKNLLHITSVVDQILNMKVSPEADTSDLEKQIDELVYKLYNLTPEEIQIIESSVK